MSRFFYPLIFTVISALAMPGFASTETAEALIDQARQGGLIIYFRHASTDKRTADRRPINVDDCQSQRNLSPLGREQARAIGQTFRQLHVPTGEILSSPYCRCKETARLAFSDFNIDSKLHFSLGADRAERKAISGHLVNLLSTPPIKGTNRIIISHSSNLKEATGIWPHEEGEAHFFRPSEGQDMEYLGLIKPGQWKDIRGHL